MAKISINKIASYLLIFLTAFIPFRELIALYTTDYIKFLPDAVIWALAAAVIVHNRFRLNFKFVDYAFCAFLLVGLVSTLVNGSSLLAFALQVRSIATMYVLFYILRNTKIEKKYYRIIVTVLMIVSLLLIVSSYFEYFSNKELLFPAEWADKIVYASNFARTYSLMNNPNTFSFFIFCVMLLVYYVNQKKKSLWYGAYYAAVFLSVFLSASRSTMIAVGLFFLFLIFDCIKQKKFRNFLIMCVALVISLVLVFSFGEMKEVLDSGRPSPGVTTDSAVSGDTGSSTTDMESSLGSGCTDSDCFSDTDQTTDSLSDKATDDGISGSDGNGSLAFIDRLLELTTNKIISNSSTDGRIYVIVKGVSIFRDYPIFGTGFGTYGSAGALMVTPEIYQKYDISESLYSDNEFIKVIVETGIVGTLVYGAFLIGMLKYCSNNRYKMFSILSFLFAGCFYNIFELHVICFVVYLTFVCLDLKICDED